MYPYVHMERALGFEHGKVRRALREKLNTACARNARICFRVRLLKSRVESRLSARRGELAQLTAQMLAGPQRPAPAAALLAALGLPLPDPSAGGGIVMSTADPSARRDLSKTVSSECRCLA